MIDQNTLFHATYGIFSTYILTKYITSKVFNSPAKSLVYAAALTFSLGLLKEANDSAQLIRFGGNADYVDVLANMAGTYVGSVYSRKNLFKNLEVIVSEK